MTKKVLWEYNFETINLLKTADFNPKKVENYKNFWKFLYN